jgi:transposase
MAFLAAQAAEGDGESAQDGMVHSHVARARWSGRRIANELDVDRGTVSRYIELAKQASPLRTQFQNAPTRRSRRAGNRRFQNQPPLFGRGRAATAEPWREIIHAKQAQGLSARRIHQDLVAEHGATVGYASVRRFLRRLGWVRPLPFRRIECSPGEEAQVDFGSVAPIVGPDGKRRRTHVFRVVLSHSRKAYSEATYRQSKYPARLAPNAGLLVHLSRKAVISAGQR